jgi:hypothetical protein
VSRRTSVNATAKPSLLLSLGLARPLTSLRMLYRASSACFASGVRSSFLPSFASSPACSSSSSSDPSTSSPLSESSPSPHPLLVAGGATPSVLFASTNSFWKCWSVSMSLADESSRFCFDALERSHKRGRVVDIFSDRREGRV